MATKKDIFKEKLPEYLKATKLRKGVILDAVIEVSGLSRKAVIRRFRTMQLRDPAKQEGRGRPRYYTSDVIAALKEVWDIGSEACGENLHSMVNEYITTQEVTSAWIHSDEATAKLRAMSLGSMKVYVGKFIRTRMSFDVKVQHNEVH